MAINLSRRSFLQCSALFGASSFVSSSFGAAMFTGKAGDFDDSMMVFLSDVHVRGGKSYQRDRFQPIVAEILKRNNLHLSAAFSLIMPDSYIGLPGFDINSEEVERSKIEQSIKKLPRIAEFILQNKTVEEVKPGPFPWSKSFILRPLFYRFFAGVRLFRSTEKCIGCGRCKNICPMQNIKLENKRPHWGNDCANCLACYHICPKNCIEYGRFSKGKGQYKLLINNK